MPVCVKWLNTFFLWTGQMQSSMMPFTISELVNLSRCLRDACLGIIKLAYPETKAEHREEYMAAFRSVGVKTNAEVQQRIQAEQKRWVQLFKVRWTMLPVHYSVEAFVLCFSFNFYPVTVVIFSLVHLINDDISLNKLINIQIKAKFPQIIYLFFASDWPLQSVYSFKSSV